MLGQDLRRRGIWLPAIAGELLTFSPIIAAVSQQGIVTQAGNGPWWISYWVIGDLICQPWNAITSGAGGITVRILVASLAED